MSSNIPETISVKWGYLAPTETQLEARVVNSMCERYKAGEIIFYIVVKKSETSGAPFIILDGNHRTYATFLARLTNLECYLIENESQIDYLFENRLLNPERVTREGLRHNFHNADSLKSDTLAAGVEYITQARLIDVDTRVSA